jgi:cysteine desulfurase
MTRTYLDHAATTPMVPEAIEAMARELGRTGNASSPHGSGRAARRVVEDAREAIAGQVGAHPTELIFTSGGTESDNLAVKGGYWSQADRGRTEIVTSVVEHHAVLDSVGWLAAAAGATARLLPVDPTGHLEVSALLSAVTPRTAVVSVMWANNEIGTLQPVAEVAERVAEHGALSHSDAVQAVGHVAFDFARSGLDLASFTAHKLGGPYGVGALLARREVGLTAVLHGGGQEREVRSGTLDVAAIAGFAAAVQVAVRHREQEEDRLRALRAELLGSILGCVPDAVPHGSTDPAGGLPGVLAIGFPGCQAESLLLLLDAAGIDCSTGSACSAGVSQPSHVLAALGASPEEARSVLRFSLGHSSTPADVTTLTTALPEAVRRARAAAAYA